MFIQYIAKLKKKYLTVNKSNLVKYPPDTNMMATHLPKDFTY